MKAGEKGKKVKEVEGIKSRESEELFSNLFGTFIPNGTDGSVDIFFCSSE